MRNVSILIATASLLTVGCGSADKKAEVPAAPVAQATEAAKNATDKAKATTEATKGKVKAAIAESSTKVECAVKGDERVMEVRAKNSGCELAYTKAGKEGIVASANNGMQYCETALEKLREKLKGAGYECK